MKTVTVTLILIYCSLVTAKDYDHLELLIPSNNPMSKALSDIIKCFPTDILISIYQERNYHEDIATEIEHTGHKAFNYECFDETSVPKIKRESTNIIFTEFMSNFSTSNSITIFCCSKTLITNVNLANKYLLNGKPQYFLITYENDAKLFVTQMFTPKACNKAQLILLNTFNTTTLKWTQKLNRKTFSQGLNFHGCQLKFYSPLSKYFFTRNSKTNSFSGMIVDLVNIMSESVNFTAEFVVDDYYQRGKRALRQNEETIFVIPGIKNKLEHSEKLTASVMEIENFILFTPTGSFLTNSEVFWNKIILPNLFN